MQKTMLEIENTWKRKRKRNALNNRLPPTNNDDKSFYTQPNAEWYEPEIEHTDAIRAQATTPPPAPASSNPEMETM